MIPNLPTPEGRRVGEELVRLYDDQAAKNPPKRERCATCAFRRGTEANGCLPTVADALKCLLEKETFHCHEKDEVCAGFEVLHEPDGQAIACPWEFSSPADESSHELTAPADLVSNPAAVGSGEQ